MDMTTISAPPINLTLNFNNRDYDFSELPRTAQLLLQDMVQIDQQLSKLQFELRSLQAARQSYGIRIRQAMTENQEGNPLDGEADAPSGASSIDSANESGESGDGFHEDQP